MRSDVADRHHHASSPAPLTVSSRAARPPQKKNAVQLTRASVLACAPQSLRLQKGGLAHGADWPEPVRKSVGQGANLSQVLTTRPLMVRGPHNVFEFAHLWD